MADVETLSHSGISVHDLKEAEDFYCGILGAHVHGAVNFVTEDTLKGRSVHQSYTLGDFLFALVLAPDFMPMPPKDKLMGVNGFRHAFAVRRADFDRAMAKLKAAGVAFKGPVDHPEKGPFGQSLYFKDPSGNFLELLWRRDEDVKYGKGLGLDVG
ncbi:MAG: Glyoxalase/Bleomycin resistance protein/Dioxygenase superfamily [Pseudomonadota bacterium]|jgi:catechol 2,3-dioxygenase-like lactoylglutathione lyase family enzyme